MKIPKRHDSLCVLFYIVGGYSIVSKNYTKNINVTKVMNDDLTE